MDESSLSLFGERESDMDIVGEIEKRIAAAGRALVVVDIAAAQARYGAFASTHEGLGVACEEWDELCAAVQVNKLDSVEGECLDLVAVLIKLSRDLKNKATRDRGVK